MEDFFISIMNSSNGGLVPPVIPEFKDCIFLSLRGQSNAEGRALVADLPAADQMTQKDIYVYYGSNRVELLTPGTIPTNPGMYGLELFLGQKLRDYHNKPVLIDITAAGGTTLANIWLTNGLWEASKNWYTDILLYRKIPKLKGSNKLLIWFQGESDGFDEAYANAYEDNQNFIFSDHRTFLGDPNAKIVDIVTASNQGTWASTVRGAKYAIGNADENIYNIDSDNYPKGDGTHLFEAGFRLLAEDIFQVVKDFWAFE